MKVQNIEQLSKLLDLCIEKGVHAIEVDGLKLNIALKLDNKIIDEVAKQRNYSVDAAERLKEMTDEELEEWSTGGSLELPIPKYTETGS